MEGWGWGGGRLNEPARQTPERQISRQKPKHGKLFSDLLKVYERQPLTLKCSRLPAEEAVNFCIRGAPARSAQSQHTCCYSLWTGAQPDF